MGENWFSRQNIKSVHNTRAVNAMGMSYESCNVDHLRDFRSKAYVNPSIVKCASTYSNASGVTLPKNIHINPNFKGRRTLLQNDKALESGSVHINPHFHRSKNEGSHYEKPQRSSLFLYNRLEANSKGNGKNGSEESILINKKSQELLVSVQEKCMTSSNQSCIQYKKTVSTPIAISKCTSKQKSPTNRSTADIRDIKTRHKIVHADKLKSQSHTVNSYRNFNRRLLNRYKLINVKRSESENHPGTRASLFHVGRNNLKKEKEHLIDGHLKLIKLKHNLKRNSFIHRITNIIKTKYIYANKMLWHKKRQTIMLKNSKHKIDKRKLAFESTKTNLCPASCHNQDKVLIKTIPSHKVKTVSCLWKSTISQHKNQNHFTWRKGEKKEMNVQRIKKSYPNRTVVKIGGIIYKSSSNKLTRAKNKKKDMQSANARTLLSSKMGHHIIYVRGEKFLLDSSGKTLVRQPNMINKTNDNKYIIRRIDLGGVTFIQNSSNVLIRTNTHHARQLVHSAKQRSIALLQHLRKRNNLPCMIYQRFGICRRYNRGMCIYVHDPKNIDLCKKFLKGECHNSDCRLSHEAVKEKMATCHFFLRGNCNKENCPYLHVKVNQRALICRDFLQGFCKLGQNCTKRHIHQCPDFEEKGVCKRSVSCPYPHKTNVKRKSRSSKDCKIAKVNSLKTVHHTSSKGRILERSEKRSVKKNCVGSKGEDLKKRKLTMEERCLGTPQPEESCNDSVLECIPKRVKLTELPLFIPLQSE